MSYSCSRHQWYSPVQPCMTCSRERDIQSMGIAQSNQAAMMRAQQQASRWPADVFERLEGERDAAVKIAATYRVENEKLRAGIEKYIEAQQLDRDDIRDLIALLAGRSGSDE